MAKTKMHLAQFLVHGPSYHSLGMWRHPKTGFTKDSWARPELYQHIARTCERGLFDMVFFADLNYIADSFTGTLEPALRYAAQAPEHDPIPLISWMSDAIRTTVGFCSVRNQSSVNRSRMRRKSVTSTTPSCRLKRAWLFCLHILILICPRFRLMLK